MIGQLRQAQPGLVGRFGHLGFAAHFDTEYGYRWKRYVGRTICILSDMRHTGRWCCVGGRLEWAETKGRSWLATVVKERRAVAESRSAIEGEDDLRGYRGKQGDKEVA